MIRILILLMTLNAIFPSAIFAFPCVSDISKTNSEQIGEVQNSSDKKIKSVSLTKSMKFQSHCNSPDVPPCADMTDVMQSLDCNAGCCADCLGVSFVLTSLSLVPFLHPISIKPISSATTFYTHTISPELQPPLV